MADLTANRQTPNVVNLDSVQGGYRVSYGIAAAEEIYVGMFVELDAGGDLTSAGAAALSQQIIGVALERKTGGAADSDVSALVLVGAVIQHALTSTLADIGAMVFASDDQTLTLTRANGSAIVGQMIGIGDSANTALIKMQLPRVKNTTAWAIINFVEDYDIDANAAVAVIADGLGTLIRDLQDQGIVSGSVTA